MSGNDAKLPMGQKPALTTTDQAIKDSLLRSMKNKWFYGMVVFLILIIITSVFEVYYLGLFPTAFSSWIVIMVLHLVLNIGMSVLAWIYIVRSWKTMKVIQFYNFKKLQKVMIPLVMLVVLAVFIFPMTAAIYGVDMKYIVPVSATIFLWYFIGVFAIRKRYSGSITNWYNNMVVILGQEVQSMEDGFTQRPYSMNIMQGVGPDQLLPKTEQYAQRMLDHVLIAGIDKMPDLLVMYIPSPTMISMMANPNSSQTSKTLNQALQHSSKVVVYRDGTLSVNVSEDDYDRIGLPITYHELCQKILYAFAGSMKAFFKGDENRAIELLGGTGYLERRRKVVKTNDRIALRIGAIATVAMLLMLIGPIPQEFTIINETENNANIGGYLEGSRAFDIYPLERPFIVGSDIAKPGDSFRVEFKANRSIPSVRIVISDGRNHEFVFKELTGLSVGIFSFTVPNNNPHSFIRLVFDFYNGSHIMATQVDVKVVQLNGYGTANMAGAIIIIGVLIIMEVLLFRKRAIAHEIAENAKQV